MQEKRQLPEFKYFYGAGPVPIENLDLFYEEGNCRRAVQLWFHRVKGLKLEPESVLNPHCYRNTGKLIPLDFSSCKWADGLMAGDIIFGERIRDKNHLPVNRGPAAFQNEEEYITSLHTGIVHSAAPLIIWHATAISGVSCYWKMEEFLSFYKPIRIRRIL